ncbi:hypothetical protein MNV49_001549 [Pseudohyphozyma bogoriensis]|nr:hypothetical protein MNV49_001549 [Pseudohyphozyma bogoriensis]
MSSDAPTLGPIPATNPPPGLSYALASKPCRDSIKVAPKVREARARREVPEFVSPPPKNAAERREWDRMSSRMEGFHSYFRATFEQVYKAADKVPDVVPLREFLNYAEELEHHLQGHHGIAEERYIFPVLRKKLPEFGEEHVEEHKAIHDGLDRYVAFITKCKSNPKDYSAGKLREIMASFGPVLFHHLDAEVETLKADNLRRYYTLAEVRLLPM